MSTLSHYTPHHYLVLLAFSTFFAARSPLHFSNTKLPSSSMASDAMKHAVNMWDGDIVCIFNVPCHLDLLLILKMSVSLTCF
uniref:Secreted protein n=1 Tax=Heterorhabditis bacteriophora TaxID=37862 RepID=A0A1I7XMT9_HETBA